MRGRVPDGPVRAQRLERVRVRELPPVPGGSLQGGMLPRGRGRLPKLHQQVRGPRLRVPEQHKVRVGVHVVGGGGSEQLLLEVCGWLLQHRRYLPAMLQLRMQRRQQQDQVHFDRGQLVREMHQHAARCQPDRPVRQRRTARRLEQLPVDLPRETVPRERDLQTVRAAPVRRGILHQWLHDHRELRLCTLRRQRRAPEAGRLCVRFSRRIMRVRVQCGLLLHWQHLQGVQQCRVAQSGQCADPVLQDTRCCLHQLRSGARVRTGRELRVQLKENLHSLRCVAVL